MFDMHKNYRDSNKNHNHKTKNKKLTKKTTIIYTIMQILPIIITKPQN